MSAWKTCTLGELAEIQTGPFGSQLHASDYRAVGIPAIMPTNIGTHLNIVIDGIAKISEENIKRLSRYITKENDIIYSRRGDVEKCAFITKNQSGWLCGTGCLRVRFTEVDLCRFLAVSRELCKTSLCCRSEPFGRFFALSVSAAFAG